MKIVRKVRCLKYTVLIHHHFFTRIGKVKKKESENKSKRGFQNKKGIQTFFFKTANPAVNNTKNILNTKKRFYSNNKCKNH